MSIRDPLNSSSQWRTYPLPLIGSNHYVDSGSCAPSGACIMLVNGPHGGSILATRNIADGPSAWTTSYTSRQLQFNPFTHGGCFSNGSCYATAYIIQRHSQSIELGISANPASKDASWNTLSAAAVTTCATPHTCFEPHAVTMSATDAREAIETINIPG